MSIPKKLSISVISLFSSALISTSTFGYPVERTIDRSIKCAMSLANHHSLYAEDIEMAAKTIKTVVSEVQNFDLMLEAVNECQQYKPTKPRRYLGKDAALGLISQLNLSKYAKKMLNGFIDPKIQCRSIGWHVGISTMLGLGMGAEIAKCSDTYGRSWLEGNVGGSIKAGLDGFAAFYARNDDRFYRTSPLTISTNSFFHTGFLASLLWGGRKNLSTDVFGIGVGVGSSLSTGAQLNLQLTPAFTSNESLRKALFSGKNLVRDQKSLEN